MQAKVLQTAYNQNSIEIMSWDNLSKDLLHLANDMS